MKKMHILYIPGQWVAYQSISAAATAMAAIDKGIEVTPDDQYTNYVVVDEESKRRDRMQLNVGMVKMPEKKKPLALPAPRRNAVPCPSCESVSVVRGTNCQSCGEYVS
jgi:hypothetical protein